MSLRPTYIRWSSLVGVLCLVLVPLTGLAETGFEDDDFEAALEFDDSPLRRDIEHPEWFKMSFLDLPEDLEEAGAGGKRGLMVYFGQKHCAYCEALIKVNFGKEDIVTYTQTHFDLIPIDIWSDRDVVDMSGEVLTEKQFAERERTQFTPSIIFYDLDGDEIFRLRGYYPPYKFRAALEYVADGHYERESFREYLARAEEGLSFEPEDLIEEDLFERPPFILDRSRFKAQRPLVVIFEQGNCHACEVLHTEQLQDPTILEMLGQFDVVQLDMWGGTPVMTPSGEPETARDWAQELGLFYSPTLLFFDESGMEIMRVDSVVRFYRLKGVLDFVLTKAYLQQPYFQRWRENSQGRTVLSNAAPPNPINSEF